ncbi:MAG: cupin domain-containing protein [Candidatus Aminicenantales bacterium]
MKNPQDTTKSSWGETPYPDMIRNLPEIDIPIPGIRGWLLQGGDKQVVFFDIQTSDEMPPHSHCNQWGLVVEGEMRLTIGDTTRTFRKGDWYYIPEGVVHSATFLSRVQVIDVFDDPSRYRIKKR